MDFCKADERADQLFFIATQVCKRFGRQKEILTTVTLKSMSYMRFQLARILLHIFCVGLVISVPSLTVRAQSTGNIPQITQSVVAGGGGVSSSGTRQVEGTAGQSVTRTSSSGPFSISSGFWSADASAIN